MIRKLCRHILIGMALVVTVGDMPALAQTVFKLSPEAQDQLGTQQEDLTRQPDQMKGLKTRRTVDGDQIGVSYQFRDVFVGKMVLTQNPISPSLEHWVYSEGAFFGWQGDIYVGKFYYFHAPYSDEVIPDSVQPPDGDYIMVGSHIRKDGTVKPGIYAGEVNAAFQVIWVPADKQYLAQFERERKEQVASMAAYIRRKEAAARSEAASGFNFGQILALGLGAAGLAAADIPMEDAIQIGSAFASDVMSGGKTNALNDYVANQQSVLSQAQSSSGTSSQGTSSSSASSSASNSTGGGSYQTEQVSINCPSGAGNTITISYKTQACRSAVINFSKVYACNLFNDFQSASSQCQSSCGDPQCRE